MNMLASLYKSHLETLQKRVTRLLMRYNLDALLLHSGEIQKIFMDDQNYPFKVAAHFKAWVPVTKVPNCWLWVDGINKPKLWFYMPVDYWHSVEPLPNDFWTDAIEIHLLHHRDDIVNKLPLGGLQVAYIGNAEHIAYQLGIKRENINPQQVIDFLDYHRSFKTDYELHCLRQAQKTAITGHQAAYEAFVANESEFGINQAYLAATQQRDIDVPYENIIAFNEHASVLHYSKLERSSPKKRHSFLIDAGAKYNGYIADVTRTYACQKNSAFSALVEDLDSEQRSLISTIKSGYSYIDYHWQMHQRIATLLKRHNLIKGMSEEAIVETGITSTFFPHGLGHFIGLQVHDVAGWMQEDTGTLLTAPKECPYLRCTRTLQPGMVITIEPGIYFIDSLLTPWRGTKYTSHFVWDDIEALKAYGGIRIEDNIVIHDDDIENMTRSLALL